MKKKKKKKKESQHIFTINNYSSSLVTFLIFNVTS